MLLHRTSTRTALALATAAAAVVTTMSPASAETVTVNDGADATASLTDIRKVRVAHGDRRVEVKVSFPNLRKKADASLSVFIDSDPDAPGPERGIGLPLFSGADYAMWRMEDWEYVGENPVSCRYGADYRWRRDVLVLSARRGCFAKADEVRVGMRMRDVADASHPVVDWLIGRRDFTDWVASGNPPA